MRIIFMGTPEFAVPVLDALANSEHEIVAVISQPDREKDKKGNLLATPVKQYAEEHSLDCLQFDKVSAHVSQLRGLNPDAIVTAAYGQLLSAEVLQTPRLGVLNVHASLLPAYRGSSPIQSAILCGEKVTGVTIMKTELSMDTGDILSKREIAIDERDTAETLSHKLSKLGASLLLEVLEKYGRNEITPRKQDDSQATYCKKITKADGLIDWSASASDICCKIRAYYPWPVAYAYLCGTPLKIYEADISENSFGESGLVTVKGNEMYVSCGSGSIKVKRMQLPGKKVLPAEEFLRGRNIPEGCVLKNA